MTSPKLLSPWSRLRLSFGYLKRNVYVSRSRTIPETLIKSSPPMKPAACTKMHPGIPETSSKAESRTPLHLMKHFALELRTKKISQGLLRTHRVGPCGTQSSRHRLGPLVRAILWRGQSLRGRERRGEVHRREC